jgi:signal transduction histidine kinase
VLGGVVSDTEQLDTTITTLLRGAREPAGHAGTCDAEAAVRAAVEVAATPGEDVTIRVVGPDHPISIGCDFDALTRMLTPVLVNARTYATSAAVVTMCQDHERVEIVVHDDGPGFGSAELEDVFSPGKRGTLSVQAPGSGLGLSLARRMARGIGGDVFASAGPGGTVTVSVPSG